MNAVRKLGIDRAPIVLEFKNHKDDAGRKRPLVVASEQERENTDDPSQYPLMDCYSDVVLAHGVEYALGQQKKTYRAERHSNTQSTPRRGNQQPR